MSIQIEFNMNSYVSVRLTEAGRQELIRQHDEFVAHNPQIKSAHAFSEPVEDAEGWSRWQMWALMNRFGHMVSLGSELPFEVVMRIESEQSMGEVKG